MIQWIKKYYSVLKMSWIQTLEYRANAVVGAFAHQTTAYAPLFPPQSVRYRFVLSSTGRNCGRADFPVDKIPPVPLEQGM